MKTKKIKNRFLIKFVLFMYYYKLYMNAYNSLCILRKMYQIHFEKLRSNLEMCRIVRVRWDGLNEFPVERTSSDSQPTMLDEFEAEIR